VETVSWYLHWFEETEEAGKLEHEQWVMSWEEVVGYFNSWVSKTSEVYKGEVICYWGDKPYGTGKPCLTFNLYVDGEEEE